MNSEINESTDGESGTDRKTNLSHRLSLSRREALASVVGVGGLGLLSKPAGASDGGIVATTDFDSGGGVELAVNDDEHHVDLTLMDPAGYWALGYFHFKLENVGEEPVSFEVTNLDASQMPSTHKLLYSTDLENPAGGRMDEQVGGGFSHSIDADEDEVFFSNYRPYPYGAIVARVNDLASNEYVETDVIGRSHEGRNMHAVRITDPHVDDAQKQDVVCLARQHPGETLGSYHMDAIVDYVLDVFEDENRQFETDYVFHFIPDVNPDGIYHGIHRRDTQGYDLNRHWDEEDPVEIANVKAYMRATLEDVHWGFDLHSTVNESYPATLYSGPATDTAAAETIERIAAQSRSLSGTRETTTDRRSRGFIDNEFDSVMMTTEAWTYHEYTLDDLREEGVAFVDEVTSVS